MGYLYLLLNIIFTTAAQVLLKSRLVSRFPEFQLSFLNMKSLLTDWMILLTIGMTLAASALWILTLEKFDLTKIYPFSLTSYILILFLGHFLLNEHVSLTKIAGSVLVLVGLIVIAKS